MSSLDEFTFSAVDKTWSWEKNDQESRELNSLFLKWNLLPDLFVKSFQASSRIQKRDEIEVIKKVFMDTTVRSSIGLTDPNISPEIAIDSLSCTILNMSFFDKLNDIGVVSDSNSGYIRGCYDEEIDGIVVQDKLRRMCAKDNEGTVEEDEAVLSEKDRNEFIFHLLKLVSIGGAKCQSEDRIHTLKNAIKTMYKELVQVRKDASGNVGIHSSVYEIRMQGKIPTIFPFSPNTHNKCYVVITEQKVTLLIKKFIPFW